MRCTTGPMRALAITLLLATGCGPIVYVNEVTNHASVEVDAAKRAGAEDKAPYWYTRAVLYLHAAREEAARADFQGANHFGRLAAESARKAQDEASKALK